MERDPGWGGETVFLCSPRWWTERDTDGISLQNHPWRLPFAPKQGLAGFQVVAGDPNLEPWACRH